MCVWLLRCRKAVGKDKRHIPVQPRPGIYTSRLSGGGEPRPVLRAPTQKPMRSRASAVLLRTSASRPRDSAGGAEGQSARTGRRMGYKAHDASLGRTNAALLGARIGRRSIGHGQAWLNSHPQLHWPGHDDVHMRCVVLLNTCCCNTRNYI
ncbi:hypothetical protein CALCODRAFT_380430 [Calocera cornea HHB12733]|uniref:Uncharacterized protein n=1 Tax=Calocera cornea HHB12733 TaxID=1353952 RepID=A0A165ECQ7_9BASI|nr:hypothetical protein CALCODRAFT_380430 [Calocera cornea HHB12733]